MAFEVRLPDIGEGVAEGEIVRWLVKAGDAVKEDQPMVEVMTDKATVEIPAPRTGVIAALHVAEGKVVPVGTVIVSIEVGGKAAVGAAAGAQHAGAATARATTPAATVAAAGSAPSYGSLPPSGEIHATPAVRALAKQLGVGLGNLRGSGPNGRIVADDVKRAAGGTGAATAAPAAAASVPGATLAAGAAEERIPLRGLRRRIAEQMKQSLDLAAQFTFVAECDMSAVVAHRDALKAQASAKGISITFMAYVLKALIEPLRRHPLVNASMDEWTHEIVMQRAVHVGMAAATPHGLVVPVVRDCDRRTLLEIASEIQRLAKGAREGSLKLEEHQGGTFTVTSTGARGGLLATPILHHPQVAILGVHEVKKRPVVVDDAIVIREMTNLSLTLDHRAVDGAVGADFLYEVIARLEKPGAWLTPEVVG